ncbi:hypothetical protein QCM77_23915 [Bradyrhizobium sp. SSUT18]|uniref:hypothetical protein n=1 Tax=unclassified Bradyrhizobium TaxID=2631580 RepID=UPI0024490D21|nr:MULTISPECIES: hypothetical protein [unclassified Bradyrhizobium]MDH2341556.1 hypothetical protein [Bradyrhizobium sp. SSUT77]MDH2402979.1 hypothetical protein [Bradyrhizobium sp. SSUT18]
MEIILFAGYRLDESHCLGDQRVAFKDPLHGAPLLGLFQQSWPIESRRCPVGDCIFFPPARQWGMDAKADHSDEAEGLRLVRAFLSLSPDKRAEVIAFAEALARAQGRPEEGTEVSPR